MPTLATAHYDVDPAKFPLDVAAFLVKEARPDIAIAARQDVLLRVLPWIDDHVKWLARVAGLSPDDRDDARQEMVLSAVRAIERFDMQRVPAGREDAFLGFLAVVADDHFRDDRKRDRRYQAHYRHNREAADASEAAAVGPDDEPEHAVECHEFWASWEAVVARLAPFERRLCDLRAARVRWEVIGRTLRVHPTTPRKKWDKLRLRLRSLPQQQM
jgi:DNA-directed RNA polymerase specialized sigma24 family protein